MIKTAILVLYNLIRLFSLRVIHRNRFKSSTIERVSPLCSLKLHNQGQMDIGHNVDFSAYCDFEVHGTGQLRVGDRCYFNRYCMISAHESVTIGDGCMFGPGVKIFDNNHKHTPEQGVSYKLSTKPIVIGKNCWIASDVVILKGAKIGDNCVIGAQCVIHGEIPAGSVVRKKSELEIL